MKPPPDDGTKRSLRYVRIPVQARKELSLALQIFLGVLVEFRRGNAREAIVTNQQIADLYDCSIGHVRAQLSVLERAGWIRRKMYGRERAIVYRFTFAGGREEAEPVHERTDTQRAQSKYLDSAPPRTSIRREQASRYRAGARQEQRNSFPDTGDASRPKSYHTRETRETSSRVRGGDGVQQASPRPRPEPEPEIGEPPLTTTIPDTPPVPPAPPPPPKAVDAPESDAEAETRPTPTAAAPAALTPNQTAWLARYGEAGRSRLDELPPKARARLLEFLDQPFDPILDAEVRKGLEPRAAPPPSPAEVPLPDLIRSLPRRLDPAAATIAGSRLRHALADGAHAKGYLDRLCLEVQAGMRDPESLAQPLERLAERMALGHAIDKPARYWARSVKTWTPNPQPRTQHRRG